MTTTERRMSDVFVLCLLLVSTALGGLFASRERMIHGTVVDATPDCLSEKCVMLARSQSQEEAKRILREIAGGRPASGAVVVATNGRVTRETISDGKGNFTFADLPMGTYTVYAMMPALGTGQKGERRVSAPKAVECGRTVRLVLHEELITISGRITDSQGRPVAGARVIGTPVPVPEVGTIETKSAVSNAQGFYELQGFEPLNLYRVAGYLNGGSLDAPDSLNTQVEIKVEARGLRQEEKLPRVPLLAEAQIVPARRLWQALSELAVAEGHGERWKEMKERPLPASQGSTITAVDIVLH